jgi:hypothetical protein
MASNYECRLKPSVDCRLSRNDTGAFLFLLRLLPRSGILSHYDAHENVM